EVVDVGALALTPELFQLARQGEPAGQGLVLAVLVAHRARLPARTPGRSPPGYSTTAAPRPQGFGRAQTGARAPASPGACSGWQARQGPCPHLPGSSQSEGVELLDRTLSGRRARFRPAGFRGEPVRPRCRRLPGGLNQNRTARRGRGDRPWTPPSSPG